MSQEKIKFSELCNFQPKQLAATKAADEHQYTLYGGSRGPGKSYWIRWYLLRELLKLAARGIVRPVVGLFCEDYPSLTDRQISKITVEFPMWLGELKESKTYGLGFHLKDEYGGGVLALRNLDDPSKYQSAEFAAEGVDELTKNTEETFEILRGSLRWTGIDNPRFIAATNPGGKGHVWVKGFWVDRQIPSRLAPMKKEFAFVAALPEDNKYLSNNYWQMLETLPERLMKAWRHGDWNAFEGQFFNTFDEGKQVVKPFEIPSGWRVFGSLDPGGSSPCSFGINAISYDKLLYRVQTYYEAGLSGEQNVRNIKKFIAECRYIKGREMEYIVSGHDAWAKKDKNALYAHGRTLNDEFTDNGMPLTKAITDRIPGWWAWKNLMPKRYFVFGQNLNKPLLNEMVSVIADERNPEDIEGRGNDPKVPDHALDDQRYGVMSAIDIGKPVEEGPKKWEEEFAEATEEQDNGGWISR